MRSLCCYYYNTGCSRNSECHDGPISNVQNLNVVRVI